MHVFAIVNVFHVEQSRLDSSVGPVEVPAPHCAVKRLRGNGDETVRIKRQSPHGGKPSNRLYNNIGQKKGSNNGIK